MREQHRLKTVKSDNEKIELESNIASNTQSLKRFEDRNKTMSERVAASECEISDVEERLRVARRDWKEEVSEQNERKPWKAK
tara:strand:+ start:399 stop:644 length:246 start_codon:yes stop_codon:yes gene_type:complete